MAMHLKRSSKILELSAVSAKKEENLINLRDCVCPICQCTLNEPVTLPCSHTLCLKCLRGTFEHNSLSCPLCRLRVSSWLRTAQKAGNLINYQLWNVIKKTQQLVNNQHLGNGDDLDLCPDEFPPRKKILSQPGEIRREYEIQLEKEKEEMRRQKEKERLASEVYIRKIQEEERNRLAQLAHDQVIAKNLAKKEIEDNILNQKPKILDSKSKSLAGTANKNNNILYSKRSELPAIISKLKNDKINAANLQQKNCIETFNNIQGHKPSPVYNAVNRIVTHQTPKVGNNSSGNCVNFTNKLMGGSSSKIYGLQSKEELHVPSDVLNNKNKKLGIEVCVPATANIKGEERIGSAESAGSHDSINQEIHHFKPIRVMQRTPLKIIDGKQIDPKLIRVVPRIRRLPNAMLVPPTPSLNSQKVFGSSWGAFKRIIKTELVDFISQNQQEIKVLSRRPEKSANLVKTTLYETDKSLKNKEVSKNDKPTSTAISKQMVTVSNNAKENNKFLKNGLIVGGCKLDVKIQEADDTSNEDINVVDLEPTCSKKLSPNNTSKQIVSTYSLEQAPMENIAERIKRRKMNQDIKSSSFTDTLSSESNSGEVAIENRNKRKLQVNFQSKEGLSSTLGNTSSIESIAEKIKKRKLQTEVISHIQAASPCTVTIENIAERIKKRKRNSNSKSEDIVEEHNSFEEKKTIKNKINKKLEKSSLKNKTLHKKSEVQSDSDESVDSSDGQMTSPKNILKNIKQNNKNRNKKTIIRSYCISSSSSDSDIEIKSDSGNESEVLKEQRRRELQLEQERKDFELAMKLQAEFNATDRRTRHSHNLANHQQNTQQGTSRSRKRACK